MPFIGLSPFLHLAKAAASLMMDACQCPLSGFLHFYMAGVTVELKKRHTVSMPFIGLSPFLPPVTKQEKQLLLQCVNALYRAFSISTGIIMKRLINKLLCQCPLSGFLHFYLHRIGGIYYEKYCVNALYRAFSISTLPSGNALKWSICRLDFAGNCLTTSKSAYFLLFLCLFTLCSYFFVIFRP